MTNNYNWPRTVISDFSFEGFKVRTKAIRKDGEKLTLYAGEESGMTSGPMPCWTGHGSFIFRTEEEAMNAHKGLGSTGWDWKIIPDTIEVVRVFGRTIKYYDEVTEAEWQAAKEGFRDYMANR